MRQNGFYLKQIVFSVQKERTELKNVTFICKIFCHYCHFCSVVYEIDNIMLNRHFLPHNTL
jgi:hypothetical protein